MSGAVLSNQSYGTSPVKRQRRSQAEMTDLLAAVRHQISMMDDRMTIRHLFYRLTSAGVIEKTESAYRNLCSHLTNWRKAGDIPFEAFVDSTRWHRGNAGFDTLEDALHECAATYRRNVWRDSNHHVELWVEKDAIGSIVTEAAYKHGVMVFVCRGFASLSSLFDASQSFKQHIREGRECHVLYFGDRDPSGLKIDESAEYAFRHTFDVNVDFRRVAVTPDQIERHQLPTRPTKRTSSHARGFEGESVEIDAMEPATIKQLVHESIEQFIDPHTLEVLRLAENEERDRIYELAQLIGGAA